MATVKPILRIFDYDKAVEFYINWLRFKIDWINKEDNLPIFMQVSFADIVFYLSEHHGDSCPGARIFIDGFRGLVAYHKGLIDKKYKYNKPGIDTPFYDGTALEMTAHDPFGNRLTFLERNINVQ